MLPSNLQPRDAFYTSSFYLPLIILFPSQFSVFHSFISLFLSQIDYSFKLFNVVSTYEHSKYNPPHHPQQIILVWYWLFSTKLQSPFWEDMDCVFYRILKLSQWYDDLIFFFFWSFFFFFFLFLHPEFVSCFSCFLSLIIQCIDLCNC